jgi:HK97 gp10 family phage protein
MPYISETEAGKGFQMSVKWEGFDEFDAMMKEMENDFSEKDQKAILRTSMKRAMLPVLATAKGLLQAHGNVDTGQLLASLQTEARKPTARDRHSSYVSPTDIMIARVTVPPGNVLAKKKFINLKNKNYKTNKIKQIGMESDGRAFAIEFGTKHMAARPFIRPALESNIGTVMASLVKELGSTLIRYKSKRTGK